MPIAFQQRNVQRNLSIFSFLCCRSASKARDLKDIPYNRVGAVVFPGFSFSIKVRYHQGLDRRLRVSVVVQSPRFHASISYSGGNILAVFRNLLDLLFGELRTSDLVDSLRTALNAASVNRWLERLHWKELLEVYSSLFC